MFPKSGSNRGDGGVPSLDQLLASDEPVVSAGEQLAQHLIQRFQSSAYQPPMLSDVAARLVELSRRPFKPTEAHQLLERDPFFAGRVLQVAQSPVHGGTAGVTSLAEAVTRLGQASLGPMFLLAATKMRIFRNRAYLKPMEQVHAHAFATAHIAKLLSRYSQVDAQVAFTAGLLHDVGIIAAMMIHGDTEPDAGKHAAPGAAAPGPGPAGAPARPGHPPTKPGAGVLARKVPAPVAPPAAPQTFEEIWPSIRPFHIRATVWLCNRWKLPKLVTDAVAQHHELRAGASANPLAAIVAAADGLAAELGYAALDELDSGQVGVALAILGLGPAQRQAVLTDAAGIKALIAPR
ncbi:MAG: HDOD domain-containing protein [Deltaproteobacteria bacterium]|nr:HDOD domain-containing protein [Deltaproteobacteria bacterium]